MLPARDSWRVNTAYVSSFVLISILRGQPRTPPSGDNLGALDYHLNPVVRVLRPYQGVHTSLRWYHTCANSKGWCSRYLRPVAVSSPTTLHCYKMTEKKNEPLRVTTFDDIFDHIGQFGRYQLVLQLIIGLMAIPLGWHNLTMSFVSPDHDHWCRVPALSALNDSMQKYVAIPMEKTRQGAERYDRCNVYNIDYNVSRDDIEKWNRTVRIKNATKMACNNGWTFDKSIFTSTVNSEVFILVLVKPYFNSTSSMFHKSWSAFHIA